uniref:Uncharacterized protein n=1 Tax=Knipowitschia caucasica TaxID=637954 RepID=A0AAV2ITE5_KNICA
MCILLYSKVGEAVVVSDVVHVWLHCGANGRASGFATVMELYLAHILLPLGQLEEPHSLRVRLRASLKERCSSNLGQLLNICTKSCLAHYLAVLISPKAYWWLCFCTCFYFDWTQRFHHRLYGLQNFIR